MISNTTMPVIHRIVVAALAVAATGFMGLPATADSVKTGDQAIQRTLETRVKTYCRPLLKAWLLSEAGMQDPSIREQVTNCYLSHSRLHVLGLASGLDLADTAISELPARILAGRVGFDLDPYRPLAGRRLHDLGGQ